MRPLLTKAGVVASIEAYKQHVDGIDHFMQRRKEAAAKDGLLVSCGAGCNHCCYLYVTIGAADAIRLALYLKDTGRDTPEMRGRLRQDAERYGEHQADHAEYFRKKIPCTFLSLVTGDCLVYGARPVVCRLANSCSPASQCQEMRGEMTGIATIDLKEKHADLIQKFSASTWAPIIGPFPEMVLWALKEMDRDF